MAANEDTEIMRKVLVTICAYESLVKDLHYRAQDEWFYALHTLADKIWQIKEPCDDLKEAYWLGWCQGVPPEEASIKADSAEYVKSMAFDSKVSNRDLVQSVQTLAADGVSVVEAAKAIPGLPGGIHAILDEISKAFLVAKGLCWRTLTHGGAITGEKEDGSGKQLAKYLEVIAAE